MEFAEIFVHEVGFTTTCIEAAGKERSHEYQRRHAFVDSIAFTETTENFERARTFLTLIADVWVVDQVLYNTTTSKKKGFCPICQIHFFTRLLNHAGFGKNAKDVRSVPTHRNPFSYQKFIHHIKYKQHNCLGHNLLAKFINKVHEIEF